MAIGKYSETSSWLGKIGSALRLPELGISELLGGDTRAMNLAKDNAATRAVGAQASGQGVLGQVGAYYSPNTAQGQDYYNAGESTLNAISGSNIGSGSPQYGPSVPTQSSAQDTSASDAAAAAAANKASIDSYLQLINQQRGTLQNQYNRGYQDINAQSGRQGLGIQSRASQGISDINTSLAQTQKQGEENTRLVRTGADVARYNTGQNIRSNFMARGAFNSSYYQRAMDAGLGDINTQEKNQLTSITQALDKAMSEATKQKNSINMELTTAMQDIEAKRQASLADLENQYNQGMITLAEKEAAANAPVTAFATPEELNKVQALANTNFQVDQYISNIDAQASSAINQIKSSAGQTQQAGVDLTNVNNLLTSLGKGLSAGYRKSDFVPLLVSKGYTPEQAQSILDQAELKQNQLRQG